MQPDFTKIYDDYSDRIYRFIYYKTYNREIAEDIMSATFLKAIEKQNSYRSRKGDIGPWLFTIARNLTIDHYRKNRIHLNINDIWDLSTYEDVAVDTENRILLEELKEYLGKLKAAQREVIIMRIWMDMPYREIAGVLGKSESSLKMMFGRTIKLLKNQMSEKEFLTMILIPLVIQLRRVTWIQ